MKSGIIYIYHCNVTNKAYIGQTSTSMKRRIRSGYGKKTLIGKAIKKHGMKNFSIRILGTYYINRLSDAERFWISFYKTFGSGYNLTEGGENHHCFSPSTIEKLRNQVTSKTVYQFNLQGLFVSSFASMGEAERKTGTRRYDISRCLRKKTFTANNFLWSETKDLWFDAERLKYLNKSHNRQILMCLTDGTRVREFLSIKEASDTMYISYSSIKKCLAGIRKHAGGYLWK